ncbi:MAG: DUF1501 domain-containing protein [Dehalococcoidia bacterium]|nr:DUF1501 domain-containing protein [Dehalococcoidia bacterium]
MIGRRDFVKKGVALVTLGTAQAMVPAVFKGAFAIRASDADAAAALPAKTLVVLQLAGGNDGLNTLVPYRDPAYAAARPTLGVAAKDVLALDEAVGLHPKLSGLKTLWGGKKLAVVQGVGYDQPSFSHFQSMLIWQNGGARAAAGEGWLSDYLSRLESEEHDPLHGFNVGQFVAPELYSTKAPTVAAPSADAYGFQQLAPDAADARLRQTALLRMYEQFPKDTPYAALLETTEADAVSSQTSLTAAVAAHTPAVQYPNTSIANGLKLIAQVVASGAKLRVAHVTLGGFDTHSAQRPEQEQLLGELGDALAAFYADLQALGKAGDVLTMTWSEFGRRVQENASAGTDHGTAAPLFVIGGGVRGGVYGRAPSLTDLDNGNLKFTTDFRSVYATLLERWCGAPSQDVLGARYPLIDGLIA